MNNTIKFIIVGFVATIVWEFGHPFIPGLVPDQHTHQSDMYMPFCKS
jgi:hypothetical protein|tara:strand:- start:9699 stop:9839 length:141 start_codon:yes stop_codon:yes gene_type:complete